MKVFYCCYGSAHSSVTAAAIHLGKLPRGRVPSTREILGLNRFDKTTNQEIGTPFFMGWDSGGIEVYVLGVGGEREIVCRTVLSLLSLWNYPPNRVILVDTLVAVHPLTRLGGFLSRRLGLVFPGRYLAGLGIKWSYQALLEVVRQTENNCRRGERGKVV